ncbi:MAG: hypothetical protein K9N46_09840 [Candidatus Marinimicrobia bacterium]|nr:hypothetical protein [Candidatus Neomarinimicrobiota bacterium]MCF7828382.1 hypothetical protein [Candidatus Neomarinimicrobiota bacterium]MCF7881024.1 hypothetical protein [Candidatus Neomarinimicrobiota bacterium]
MSEVKLAGLLLIIGSSLFIISAFAMPNVAKIYMEPSVEGRLAIVRNFSTGWTVHNVLFILGSTLTAVSLVYLVTKSGLAAVGNLWLMAGAVLVLVAVIPWDWHLVLRLSEPDGFARNIFPGWLFVSFTLLMLVGLGSLGIGMLSTPFPGWLGWTHIIGAVVLIILSIVFRDMPPFVYYIFTLITGILCLQEGFLAELAAGNAPLP